MSELIDFARKQIPGSLSGDALPEETAKLLLASIGHSEIVGAVTETEVRDATKPNDQFQSFEPTGYQAVLLIVRRRS